MKEYENYEQTLAKPKIDWQEVWNRLGSVFGWATGIGSGIAVTVGMIAAIVIGVSGCQATQVKYDDWSYNCKVVGNTVVSMPSAPDLCMSVAKIERPMDGWSFNSIECAKMNGIEGMIDNTTVCYIGTIVSKQP